MDEYASEPIYLEVFMKRERQRLTAFELDWIKNNRAKPTQFTMQRTQDDWEGELGVFEMPEEGE